MSNNNIYKYALSKLVPKTFEHVSTILISNKFPSIGLRFPSDHSGGDGGEDAWDELFNIKYAFSIQKTWKAKLKDEIEKLQKSAGIKERKAIRFLTNQNISTIDINKFKQDNTALISNIKIEVYALNELTEWLENYFSTTNDIELYNLLGISSLLVGERGLISFGFNNNEENLEGFLENDNQYNKEISYHDLNSNSAYQDPRKIVSNNVIFDLLNECLAKNENYHYLISADAGMGKSYEMKKTVYLLHKKAEAENQKDLMERKPSIQAYYYPLCTYTSDNSSPWKEFTPKHPQERFYVFLDGFDELAEENQNILIKKIQEEFRNRPQTFFVISARPLSFSYTSIASVFDTRTIKANISIPDSKSTREQSFKEIPFFRDLITKLDIPNNEAPTRTFLIKKAIKNDYRRRAKSVNANLDSLFEKKLDRLLSYTCKFTQTLINKNTWSKEHVSNFLEEIDKEDQKEFLSFLNDSMFISLLSDDNYSFSHNIYKEYLTAFNLLDMYKKEIPNVFLTGINNELIKSKYYNTYSLWLSLLSEDKELKPLYEKAIGFVLNEENIQTLFLCDQSIFSSNDILNIVETTFKDYEKYRFIIYPYAPVLSSYINDIDNTGENKFIDQLIEKIKTMIVNDEIINLDIDLHFLENILKQNKEQVRYQEEVKNLLNLLIDTINKNNPQERYDELFPIIFLLESIVRLFEPEFNSYEYLEKNVDTSYKQEFKNEQRAIDFYSDYNQNTEDVDGAIERHETNLLDVIWPMITLKKTGFKAHYAPSTLTDTYKRKVNPFKMDYFEYFLGKFAHRYTDSTEESLPKIPTKLRKFILEALEQILSKIETENIDTYSNHIYTNRTLSHIKSIFLRMCIGILPDELDQVENIFFSHNIVLMEIFMHDNDLLEAIVTNLDNEDKVKWLEKSLDLGSKYGDRTIYPYRFIKLILNSLVDMDSLEKHIEIIEDRYNSCPLNTSIENIYKFALDYLMHAHPLKDTIKDKISDNYNRFWKDRDEKQKVRDAKREELLKALNDIATDNIGNEIESLFDKAKFKEAAFKILDVLDENDSDYNNLTYSAMALKIKEQREMFDINYQLPDPIINYDNQIVLMFLWRYAKNISRDQLEKMINSDDWVAWVFIIIINLCIEPPNESKDRALQNDKLDFKKLYTKHLLEEDTLGKFNESFSKLEEQEKTETIQSIRLIIYIWKKHNNNILNKKFTDDDIYGFIQCIGLRHHNLIDINSDKSSYAHIIDNLLDKDNTKVVTACKRYIEENKNSHPTENTTISIITKHIINYLVENNERDDTLDENILLIHLSYKKHDLLLGATRNYIEHNNLYSKLEEKFCKEGIVKYLELLDSGMQFHFITHIILEHREFFETSIASLKRIFNTPMNNISKYDLVFTVLDKNTDALKWLTDYFTKENGDLTHSYIYDHYENLSQIINSYSFESNVDLDNIIKLLDYSFDEDNDSVRREQIGKYAFMWLSNSATQDNLQYIKDKLIEKANSNKRLELALNNRTYLRDLEEKAFSNNGK